MPGTIQGRAHLRSAPRPLHVAGRALTDMLGAIDHAAIAQGGLDASAPSAGRQFQGSSVCRSRAFVRPETTRSSTSVSQAIGSTPFSFAVVISVMAIAQC